MGNEKHSLLRICCKETAVKFALGGLIKRAANLIEQEGTATMQQTTGYGNALSLPLAETAAPLT